MDDNNSQDTIEKQETRFIILVDTREQHPLAFPGFETERTTLASGDYSVICDGKDMRDVVAIERKSISDLLNCVGQDRTRFEREMYRLAEIPYRALVIEDSMLELAIASRDTQMTVKQVFSSTLAWVFKYQLPVLFCSGRHYAAATVRTLLLHGARYAQEDTHLRPVNGLERRLRDALQPVLMGVCSVGDALNLGPQKHPDGDGFQEPASFHIDRARMHLEALTAGYHSQPHIEHAATRLLMAMEILEMTQIGGND